MAPAGTLHSLLASRPGALVHLSGLSAASRRSRACAELRRVPAAACEAAVRACPSLFACRAFGREVHNLCAACAAGDQRLGELDCACVPVGAEDGRPRSK